MASLTPAEQTELRGLQWEYRYYMDSWLATMKVIDLLRPLVVEVGGREGQVFTLLECGEISKSEAQCMLLGILRKWRFDYREMLPEEVVKGDVRN